MTERETRELPEALEPAKSDRMRGWLQALLFPAMVAAAVATYWAAVDRDPPIDAGLETEPDAQERYLAQVGVGLQEKEIAEGRLDRIVATREPLDAEDLSRIAKLRDLRALTIGVFEGGQEDLASLRNARRLETLHLHEFPLSDAGAASLAKAVSLRVLNVDAGAFGDEGLASLANLPKLELLRIRSPQVGDAGIEALARRANGLKHLHVLDARLTDESLEQVASIERLESFYVDGIEFSEAAWKKFVAARPDVHVHVDELHLPEVPQGPIEHK